MKGRKREMNHLSPSPSQYEISKIKMRCDRHECDGIEIDICLRLFPAKFKKDKNGSAPITASHLPEILKQSPPLSQM